jgi:hypothetical protein
MARALYAAGDVVVLRDGPLRHGRGENTFKILAVMPDAYGQTQYRVRSESEGFDRRIVADEIDTDRSAASRSKPAVERPKTGPEPWFKAAALKTSK